MNAQVDPLAQMEETIREMIHREDGYRGTRLGWFCTLQGLLFTALSLASDKSKRRLMGLAQSWRSWAWQWPFLRQ